MWDKTAIHQKLYKMRYKQYLCPHLCEHGWCSVRPATDPTLFARRMWYLYVCSLVMIRWTIKASLAFGFIILLHSVVCTQHGIQIQLNLHNIARLGSLIESNAYVILCWMPIWVFYIYWMSIWDQSIIYFKFCNCFLCYSYGNLLFKNLFSSDICVDINAMTIHTTQVLISVLSFVYESILI